jgi:HEAT repeat protein
MTSLLLAIVLATQADKQAEEAAAAAVTTCEQVFVKNKDAGARTEAINTMSRTQHEKVLAKLLVYMSDADKGVKIAAVTGTATYVTAMPDLKRLANKNLVRSLEAGANVKDIDFRVAVAGALGAFGDPASNTTLKTLLDDKNLKVATAAVNACVAMKQKPLLEALMEQQRECEKTMRASANSSFKAGKKPVSARKDPNAPPDPEEVKNERAAMLVTLIPGAVQSLTGQEFKSGAEMEAWWSKNKSSFNFPEK